MSTPHPDKATYVRHQAPDITWAKNGACARHPEPDLWFARIDDESRSQQAIAICQTCPVKAACLEYALSVPGLDGIWAGTTKTARDRLRKNTTRRRKAA